MSIAVWIAIFIPVFVVVILPNIRKMDEEKKEGE
jgi:hypothetical protein